MKYENYSAEDFFNDENFRSWILTNDPAHNYFWEKWIMHNPEKKKDVLWAKRLVLSLKFKDEEITTKQKEEIWKRIQADNRQFDQTGKSESKVMPLNNGNFYKAKRDFSYYFYRSAAVILLLLFSWYLLQESPTQEKSTEHPIMAEKVNPSGQKSKIYLSDGSVVHLNADSKISYFENFEADRRVINLSGEAFFEVAKDTLRPLIVVSGSVHTKALGTKFNINAFPEDKEIIVSLLEGKVEVIDALENQRLILEEHQAAKYILGSNMLDRVSFDHSESMLWKYGILYFYKSPLSEVITELERWYGVKISISGSPGNRKMISGRFENESLANVLQSIAFSSDFDYQINGKKVSIQFKQ